MNDWGAEQIIGPDGQIYYGPTQQPTPELARADQARQQQLENRAQRDWSRSRRPTEASYFNPAGRSGVGAGAVGNPQANRERLRQIAKELMDSLPPETRHLDALQFVPDRFGGHLKFQSGIRDASGSFKPLGEAVDVGVGPMGKPTINGAMLRDEGGSIYSRIAGAASQLVSSWASTDPGAVKHKSISGWLGMYEKDYTDPQSGQTTMGRGRDWEYIGPWQHKLTPADEAATAMQRTSPPPAWSSRENQYYAYRTGEYRPIQETFGSGLGHTVQFATPGRFSQDDIVYTGDPGIDKSIKRAQLTLQEKVSVASSMTPEAVRERRLAQANFTAQLADRRETAYTGRAAIALQPLLPEGQGIINTGFGAGAFERFEDFRSKFRVKLPDNVQLSDVDQYMSSIRQDGQRDYGHGQRIQLWEGHEGVGFGNWERARMTGYTYQEDETGRYIQMQGYRSMGLGGNVSMKAGGFKSFLAEADLGQMGLAGYDMLMNAPSNPRQAMAWTMGFMDKGDLSALWKLTHGEQAQVPDRFTHENSGQFEAVWKQMLENPDLGYVKDMDISQAMTGEEMKMFQEAGRVSSYEQLGDNRYRANIRTRVLDMERFGMQFRTEMSDMSKGFVSWEELAQIRHQVSPEMADRLQAMGQHYRASFNAMRQAHIANQGLAAPAAFQTSQVMNMNRMNTTRAQAQETIASRAAAIESELIPRTASDELRNTIGRRARQQALTEFAGQGVIQIGGTQFASPQLTQRFGFIDPETDEIVNKYQIAATNAMEAMIGGDTGKAEDLAKIAAGLQTNLLGTGMIRREGIGTKSSQIMEHAYLADWSLQPHEVALSNQALSRMYGVSQDSGKFQELQALARAGQLKSNAFRAPLVDPTRQLAAPLNVVTQEMLSERGSAMNLGEGFAPAFSPIWSMFQQGDQDADRMRLFAMSRLASGGITPGNLMNQLLGQALDPNAEFKDEDGALKAFQMKTGLDATPDQIRDWAKTNVAGEYQSYMKKISMDPEQATAKMLSTLGAGHRVGDIAKQSQFSAQILGTQIGTQYNIFERLLADFTPGDRQQEAYGLAARLYQPLIDKKPYLSGPVRETLDLLNTYNPITGGARIADNPRKIYDMASAGQLLVRNQLDLLKSSPEGDRDLLSRQIASVITSSGMDTAPVAQRLQEFAGTDARFSPGQVSQLMPLLRGQDQAWQESDAPMASLLRGYSTFNMDQRVSRAEQLVSSGNAQALADYEQANYGRSATDIAAWRPQVDALKEQYGGEYNYVRERMGIAQKDPSSRYYQTTDEWILNSLTQEGTGYGGPPQSTDQWLSERNIKMPTRTRRGGRGGAVDLSGLREKLQPGLVVAEGRPAPAAPRPAAAAPPAQPPRPPTPPTTVQPPSDPNMPPAWHPDDVIYSTPEGEPVVSVPTGGAVMEVPWDPMNDHIPAPAPRRGGAGARGSGEPPGGGYGGTGPGGQMMPRPKITAQMYRRWQNLAAGYETMMPRLETLRQQGIGPGASSPEGKFLSDLQSAMIDISAQRRTAEGIAWGREGYTRDPEQVSYAKALVGEATGEPSGFMNQLLANEPAMAEMAEFGFKASSRQFQNETQVTRQTEKMRKATGRTDLAVGRYNRDIELQQQGDIGVLQGRLAAGMQAGAPGTRSNAYARMAEANTGAIEAYQEWESLNQQFVSGGRSNKGLATKMNDLAESIELWNNEAKGLRPLVQEHAKLLSDEISSRRESLSDIRTNLTNAQRAKTALDEEYQAAGGAKAGLLARYRYGQESRRFRETIADYQESETDQVRHLGRLEGEQDYYRGLPGGIATPRKVKAQRGVMGQMWDAAGQEFGAQKLFYQSQALMQGYYMLGMPLMQARDQFVNQQFLTGQADYAMGMGGMGADVERARAVQSSRSDFFTDMGEGVNWMMQPLDNALISANQSSQESGEGQWGAGQWAGAVGLGGLAAVTGGFGLSKLKNVLAPAGRSIMSQIRAQPATTASALSTSRTGMQVAYNTGVATAGRPNLLSPSKSLLGPPGAGAARFGFGSIFTALAGADLGTMGYDIINQASGWGGASGKEIWNQGATIAAHYGGASPEYTRAVAEQQDSYWDVARKGLAAGGGLFWGNTITASENMGMISQDTSNWAKNRLGSYVNRLGNEGVLSAVTGGNIGAPGTFLGGPASSAAVPRVEIANTDDLAGRLKEAFTTSAGPQLSDEDIQLIRKTWGEATGISEQQMMKDPKMYGMLEKFISGSLTSGTPISEIMPMVQAAPGRAGYSLGSPGAVRGLEYLSQFSSMRDFESRAEAWTQMAPIAAQTGIRNDTRLAEAYRRAKEEGGDWAANQAIDQMVGLSPERYSQLAYRAGLGQFAVMDEQTPWKPKFQDENWALEDRRRQYDVKTNLGSETVYQQPVAGGIQNTMDGTWSIWSGGRQQQELTWAQDRMKLEGDYWDFRQGRERESFDLNMKMRDLQIRQFEYNISREKDYASLQKENFERNYQLNLKLFDLQTEWQQQDFAKQGERMDTQRSWQVEDLQSNRVGFELQAGWQQEDLQRNYRYATGRQRLELRRQMGRASIMANLQRTQMARQEERASTQYEWNQEDLDTQQERYNTARPMQREQMTGNYKYQSQMMQMQEQDREQQRAFNEESLGHMKQQRDMEQRFFMEQQQWDIILHQQDVAIQEQKLKWQMEDLFNARVVAHEEEIRVAHQREMITAQQVFNAQAALGRETIAEYIPVYQKLIDLSNQLVNQATRIANPGQSGGSSGGPASQGSDNPVSPEKIPEFAAGGPVSETGLALIHKGEFVVPQGGTLVQGDGAGGQQVVALLSAILGKLNSGGVLVLDAEAIKNNGFIHIDDYGSLFQ